MPKIEISEQDLVITLSPAERVWALRWEIRVPLASIASAKIEPQAIPWSLGVRAPGTFFPWLIAAGTYWKRRNKQFAYWTKGQVPVVIELSNAKFNSLILGSDQPEELIARITSSARLTK